MIRANQYEWGWSIKKYVFRAVPGAGEFPAITTPAASLITNLIWIPKSTYALDRVCCWTESTDPAVGAGGATTITLDLVRSGVPGAGVGNSVIGPIAIANWNVDAVGGGRLAPTSIAQVPLVAFGSTSQMAISTATGGRALRFTSDVGSITGSIWVAFRYTLLNSITFPQQ